MGIEKKLRVRYNNMKQRCYNPKHTYYRNYGDRGIKVCDEWLGENGFIKFKEWAIQNGFEDRLQLDRINNNGNYSPDNCRWVDRKTNMRNTRSNVRIGNKTLMDISDDTGIKYSTLESRYKTCGDIELKERNCILCNKKFMPQKFEQQFCSQECRDKKYGIKINILVKKVREEKSMTLYTLAKLSGISKGHLSKIEREERDPKLVTLIQIAQALEVDVKELYEIVP